VRFSIAIESAERGGQRPHLAVTDSCQVKKEEKPRDDLITRRDDHREPDAESI